MSTDSDKPSGWVNDALRAAQQLHANLSAPVSPGKTYLGAAKEKIAEGSTILHEALTSERVTNASRAALQTADVAGQKTLQAGKVVAGAAQEAAEAIGDQSRKVFNVVAEEGSETIQKGLTALKGLFARKSKG